MNLKKNKIIYAPVLIFLILFLCVFFLYPKIISAQSLEIHYPTVSGKTVTSNTDLPGYMSYLFNIGMFIGFFSVMVSLTVGGAMYFLSLVSPQLKAGAKDRISGSISGLLIITLLYLIITAINPQLNIFNLNKLPQGTQNPDSIPAPGVYFFKGNNCSSSENSQPNTSDVPNFNSNQIGSVCVMQDNVNNINYMPIIYSSTDFQGKCQILNPNKDCQKKQCESLDNFTNSASVIQYNDNPNGDGVYFYRKSCFAAEAENNPNSLVSYCNQNSGGYFRVGNSQIQNRYEQKLEDLQFQNVPKEEQQCIKYDKNGNCSDQKPQTLGGENISSIIINGNYKVLLVYKSPKDSSSGPWSSCQLFPTDNDTNKIGPQQIKWEDIRNSGDVIPNYVVILPVKQ